MSLAGDALLEATDAYRINHDILGNLDPALHAHIIPRYLTEPDEFRKGTAFLYDRQYQESVRFDRERDRRYWLRLLRLALAALVVGVVGTLVGALLLTASGYAHALTHPGCGDAGRIPADVGIAGAQDVAYPSHDGLTLHAWYLPPQNGAAIILLPGLGGARDGMLREGAILARHGYGLLLTETRSCARSDGQATLGYKEALDLAEAVTWLRGQPGVEHVGVLGFSMGGVTAILGAAQDERIEAVVAEGGFYDLAADITDEGSGSWWKRAFHQAILFFFRRESGVDARAVSPISAIDRISPRSLLLIYGDQEAGETHPQEQLAYAGEPKDLWIVPHCGHGQYLDIAAAEWERRVVTFFDAAFSLPVGE
jgi:dipeptidyl aminopeptidase/acylaminoacyl peptidase